MTVVASSLSIDQSRTWKRAELVAVSAAVFGLTVCVAVRLLTLDAKLLNTDEAWFCADAVAISQQDTLPMMGTCNMKPPGHAWGLKPPGVHWFYQGVFALGGYYNMALVRTVGLLCVLATCGALYGIGRRLCGGVAGAWAVALYAVGVSLDPRIVAVKTEILLNLPVVAGVWLCLRGLETRRRAWFLASGLAVGAACVFKQPALFVWFGMLAAFAWLAVRPTDVLLRRDLLSAGWWTGAGVAIVGGGVLALYLAFGGLGELWTHLVVDPTRYSVADPLSTTRRLIRMFTYTEEYGRLLPILLPLSVAGAILALRRSRFDPRRPGSVLLVAVFVATAAIVPLGPELYLAYYLMPLPLAAVAGGVAVAELARLWPATGRAGAWTVTVGAVLAATFFSPALAALKGPVKSLTGGTGSGLAAGSAGSHPPSAVAAQINRLSAPQDRVFVWGYEPEVFLYTGLIPANRFEYHDLLERKSAEPELWQRFLHDLAADAPRFVVDAAARPNWGAEAFDLRNHPALRAWLDQHYRPVMTADYLVLHERREQPLSAVVTSRHR